MVGITQLLERVNAGAEAARDTLFAAAYPYLRRLARLRLRDGGRNTLLETTALVHECYLRFAGPGTLRARDQRAFYRYAAHVMRSVIVDSARRRKARRHGGALQRLTLPTEAAGSPFAAEDAILRIHEALDSLAEADPRLAQVVEMRYFGGYTDREIAAVLQLTERTVQRDWEKARLLLASALNST
jgi:RNA polymerase sigma factor (TIGR02999 family)